MKAKVQTQTKTLMNRIFSDHEEKRQRMFLYVAKEVSGRSLARSYRESKKELDWQAFSDKFNKEYENYSSDELLEEILANVYWLKSEEQVIDLYFKYLNDAKKNSSSKSENKEFELDFSK
jgi:hypothetical protein